MEPDPPGEVCRIVPAADLPAGVLPAEPFGVGRPVIAGVHDRWRPLEDIETSGGARDLWHDLDGRSTGTYDRNALVRETVHEVDNAYGLYWANPKNPNCVAELRDYLADPKFRGCAYRGLQPKPKPRRRSFQE